jgi:hypothetical protein
MGWIGTIARLIKTPIQTVIPPPINGWIGTYVGNGVCSYIPQGSTGAFAMTGSQTTETFQPPRGHALLRAEFQVLTSSNQPDASATNIELQVANPFIGSAGLTIASTNGTVADDSVVFEFESSGWANRGRQYIILSTAPNTDVLTVEFLIQYIGEPSTI